MMSAGGNHGGNLSGAAGSYAGALARGGPGWAAFPLAPWTGAAGLRGEQGT